MTELKELPGKLTEKNVISNYQQQLGSGLQNEFYESGIQQMATAWLIWTEVRNLTDRVPRKIGR